MLRSLPYVAGGGVLDGAQMMIIPSARMTVISQYFDGRHGV